MPISQEWTYPLGLFKNTAVKAPTPLDSKVNALVPGLASPVGSRDGKHKAVDVLGTPPAEVPVGLSLCTKRTKFVTSVLIDGAYVCLFTNSISAQR